MMGNSYLNKSGVFFGGKKTKQIAIFSRESPEISGWGEVWLFPFNLNFATTAKLGGKSWR